MLKSHHYSIVVKRCPVSLCEKAWRMTDCVLVMTQPARSLPELCCEFTGLLK